MKRNSKYSSAGHRNTSHVLHHVKENENMAYRENTRWLVVSKWLESFEKVFVFFGGKFKCFFGIGPLIEEARLFERQALVPMVWLILQHLHGRFRLLFNWGLSPNIWFGVVNNISYHVLTVFHLSLSTNLLPLSATILLLISCLETAYSQNLIWFGCLNFFILWQCYSQFSYLWCRGFQAWIWYFRVWFRKFLSIVVQNFPKLGTSPISFPKLPRKRFLFSFNLSSYSPLKFPILL